MVGLVFFFHGKKNVCFRLNFLLIKTCYLLLDVIQMLRSGLGWYFLLHSKHKCDFWCFRDIYQTLLPILLYTFTSGRGWGSSVWERFLYLLFTDCLTLYSFSPLNLFCFPVWSYSVKTMESNSSKKAELCVGTLCWGDNNQTTANLVLRSSEEGFKTNCWSVSKKRNDSVSFKCCWELNLILPFLKVVWVESRTTGSDVIFMS